MTREPSKGIRSLVAPAAASLPFLGIALSGFAVTRDPFLLFFGALEAGVSAGLVAAVRAVWPA